MIKFYKKFSANVFSWALVFLLIFGPTSRASTAGGVIENEKENFAAAVKDYQQGLYEQSAAKLEHIIKSQQESDPGFIAKTYLMLGACYENLRQGEKAKGFYLKVKKMRDENSIEEIPAVTGVEIVKLNIYQEVFTEPYFEYKKPVPTTEVIKKKVKEAPRKSIEVKSKEKKKKKFPWLIVVGSVVVVGTVAVLLLTQGREKKYTEAPEIDWIKIPAGEFLMGDNFVEGDADELPVHKVYLDEYYISKYEITFSDYNKFCADTGRWERDTPRLGPSIAKETPGPPPLFDISWNNAKAFCDWFSEKTGEKINLPTEAQWEKAARNTNQYRYPWGNDRPTCAKSNHMGCFGWIPFLFSPVGDHPDGISPYGVHDMAGNLAEWCRDWYSPSYYSTSPVNNPTGPASGSFRVIRGGGFESDDINIRSADREFKSPNYLAKDVGFRIVKEK